MKKNKIYAIVAITLMIDQLVKLIVSTKMKVLSSIEVIPKFFSITYVENKGAAFGIFEGSTLPLILISIIIFFVIAKFLDKEKNITKLSGLAYGIILGGIAGNLVDRLLYGVVKDYLSFSFFGYNYPVFNIADIGIVVGVIVLIIDLIRGEINESRSGKSRKKN